MRSNQKKTYLYGMLAGFGAISLSILFFFLLYRYQGFGDSIRKLMGILAPFIYGAVIAYLLKPVCNTYENFFRARLPDELRRAAAPLAILLSMLTGLLIVYALIIMIIPQLVGSIISLFNTLPDQVESFIEWLELTFRDNKVLLGYIDTGYETLRSTFNDWVKNDLTPMLTNLISGVGSGVVNVVITVKNIVIGLIIAVYLLASRRRFGRQAKLALYSILKPAWADVVMEELRYANRMFEGFINGKILDSAIIGVLCYIVSVIVGFPNALLVSAIVGVTNVIPFFGPFIGAVPATLLILIQDPLKAFWFVIFIVILQQVDGNIIGPKILGNTTGLSSFWVLFSILLFGGLWGFVGMIIGVPLFAVIYDILKKLILRGLHRHHRDDLLYSYHHDFETTEERAAEAALQTAAIAEAELLAQQEAQNAAPALDPAVDSAAPQE